MSYNNTISPIYGKEGFMPVIVGGVIKRAREEFLLVQEAQEKCRGKWNIPAGHLDANETLFEAAKREIKEGSGLDVNLTGICQIGNDKYRTPFFCFDCILDRNSFRQNKF